MVAVSKSIIILLLLLLLMRVLFSLTEKKTFVVIKVEIVHVNKFVNTSLELLKHNVMYPSGLTLM